MHTWYINGVVTSMLQPQNGRNDCDGWCVYPPCIWPNSKVAFNTNLPGATTSYKRYPTTLSVPAKWYKFIIQSHVHIHIHATVYTHIHIYIHTYIYIYIIYIVHLRSLKIIHTTDDICIASLSTWPVFSHTKVSALELHASYHSSATWLTHQTTPSNQVSRNNSTCITESDSTKCQSPPNSVSDDDLNDGDKTSCVSAHIALSCTAADAILLATTPYASHERSIA